MRKLLKLRAGDNVWWASVLCTRFGYVIIHEFDNGAVWLRRQESRT